MPKKLFFLSVIDDILQSCVAIKMLAEEGIRNTCRRELRYIIELVIKACCISQKHSKMTFEDQVSEYKKELRTTNISIIDNIDLYLLGSESKATFLSEIKRFYGEMSNYVHVSPNQIQERISLVLSGRSIGFKV